MGPTVLPGAPVGALSARIGSGAWFMVGASQTFHAQEDSEVTVAYNDRSGLYGDNSGEYTALVENHGRPSWDPFPRRPRTVRCGAVARCGHS
ncbi:hypothetical protein [Streptomyces griseoluteus]|uniref:hypothetical protein n=1 Tax=Streptomyces griseoluteus TaxID=29306 RepID=UPI0037F89D56